MLSDLERQWWNDQTQPPVQTTSGEAIAALVLGICGLCILPVIGPMLALVFGYRGRAEVDRSRGRVGGRGLAVAGIVLGWTGLAIDAFWVYMVLFATISLSPA
jgi:Domain of unknown function (DUF4190)